MDEKARWLAEPANQAQAELREALDRAAARETDEVALRRVWSRLAEIPSLIAVPPVSAGDRRSRARWPWIVGASLAGAGAALVFVFLQNKPDVRSVRFIARQTPTVTTPAKRDSSDQRSSLVAPATVRTGFGETLHLALRGGTEVTVNSESTLALDENDKPSVPAGEVEFHVPPQPAGRTFAVTAGAFRVVVVGTRFRVRVNEHNTAVGVEEGTVEIWTDHRVARVGAGQSWVSPTLPASSTEQPAHETVGVPAAKESIGVSHAVRSSRSFHGGAGAGLARRLGQERRKDFGRMVALGTPAMDSAAGSSTSGLTSSSTVTGGSASSEGDVATSAPAPAMAPAPVSPAATVVPAAPPPIDTATLALQARAARAAGEPRKALGLYRALALRGGAAGENAEYELGRLLRDGLHQPHEALLAWRSYRVDHPHGMLRVEADISVIETLVSLGDKEGALSESSEFIKRYPDSERRMEMARLTGDLLRERGDCGAAIDAYNLALGSGRSRRDVADSVSFHRSTCVLRGNRSEGAAAVRAYLQTFPAGRFRGEALRLLTGLSAQPASARP
jgi:ferric-dicitrate binding protein FerR (iron transport regulator)